MDRLNYHDPQPPSLALGPLNFSISFPGAAIATLLGSVLPLRGPSLCWVHLSVCLSSPPECTSVWPPFPVSTQQDGLFLRAIAPFPGDTSVCSPSPSQPPLPWPEGGAARVSQALLLSPYGQGHRRWSRGTCGNSLLSAEPCSLILLL